MKIETMKTVLDSMDHMVEAVEALDGIGAEFKEAVECYEYDEAANFAGRAVDVVLNTAVQFDTDSVRKVLDDLFPNEPSALDRLTGALEGVKDFFLDAKAWVGDLPTERWLPIATTVIMAAAQLKIGNIAGGLALAAKAVSDLCALASDYPEVAQGYVDPQTAPVMQPKYMRFDTEELVELGEI